jgi:HEXXH motif-containing protein
MLALRHAKKLQDELSICRPERTETTRRWFEFLEASISGLSPIALAAAFDPLPSTIDIPIESDDSDPRSKTQRTLACLRYLIARPEDATTTVLPLAPSLFDEDGSLYLPHLRLVIQNTHAPIAVTGDPSRTRLTWTDGFALTLSHESLRDAPQADHSRFRIVASILGIPVLNHARVVARAVSVMDLCPDAELPANIARVTDGFQLLRDVWPDAFHSALRQVKGLIVLRPRNHTRSDSPLSMLGLVALSCGEATSAADLIVHESSHIRLNLMRQFDPLWTDAEPATLHESPWRPDLRPLLGIVLGVHAFLNVAIYYRRLALWAGGNSAANMLFERQRAKVRIAWETARSYAKPTALGESFFADLEREVQAL